MIGILVKVLSYIIFSLITVLQFLLALEQLVDA